MSPTIKTKRLALRPAKPIDAIPVFLMLSNLAVSENLSGAPHPYTLDDAERWLSAWRNDAQPMTTKFIIEITNGDTVGAVVFDEKAGNAHIGYWLGEQFWNRGFMTEALKASIKWYFSAASADIITSGFFYFNTASRVIQEKLGFVETGRSMVFSDTRKQDIEHIDTRLTRKAFEAALK